MKYVALPRSVDGLLFCTVTREGEVSVWFRDNRDTKGNGDEQLTALLNLRERLADHLIAIDDALAHILKGNS